MKLLGGLALLCAIMLTGCSAPMQVAEQPVAEIVPVVDIGADKPETMLEELRPLLTKLKDRDSSIYQEAYEACSALLDQDKDAYRKAVLKKYKNVELATDHLMVAAAAKKHICP